MDPITVGLIGSAIFVFIIFLRLPIAYGMLIVGLGGLMFIYPRAVHFSFSQRACSPIPRTFHLRPCHSLF